MARIVDVEGFLRQCRFAPDAGESRLLLEVTDDFAPWNAGRYEIAWAADGTAAVRRVEVALGTGTGEPAEVAPGGAPGAEDQGMGQCGGDGQGEEAGSRLSWARCSIGDLTAMLLGYRRPRALHRTGRLEGDEAALLILERRIRARPTAIFDFF